MLGGVDPVAADDAPQLAHQRAGDDDVLAVVGFAQVKARARQIDGDRLPFTVAATPFSEASALISSARVCLSSTLMNACNASPSSRLIGAIPVIGTVGDIFWRANVANLALLEREIKRYLKWERPFHPVRFLNLLPLSHVFGQFMGVFVPQLLGGEVFFQESLSPLQILETVKRERISVVVTVPRFPGPGSSRSRPR